MTHDTREGIEKSEISIQNFVKFLIEDYGTVLREVDVNLLVTILLSVKPKPSSGRR